MKSVVTMRIEADVKRQLQAKARASRRPFSNLIGYYAFLGLVAEENPDLPLPFIKDVLEAIEEKKAGLGKPYKWGIAR